MLVFSDTVRREFGLESLGVKGDSRVVPIILLQFSRERAVLIDNVHQAISQPVAILAVQASVKFVCIDQCLFVLTVLVSFHSLLTDTYHHRSLVLVPFNLLIPEMLLARSRRHCWKQFGVLQAPT
jgi:hypothetical protein